MIENWITDLLVYNGLVVYNGHGMVLLFIIDTEFNNSSNSK